MTQETIRFERQKRERVDGSGQGTAPRRRQPEPLPHLRCLRIGLPGHGAGRHGPAQISAHGRPGLDEEIKSTPWVWMCSMCQRCVYVCPMEINIPQLVYNARATWPREERPKGILGSCDMALRNESCSAMGASPEDFNSWWKTCWRSTRRPSRNLPKCRPPSTSRAPNFSSTRTPGNRSPNPMKWCRCGRSCTLVGADWTYGIQRVGRRKLLHVPGRRRGLETHYPTSAKQADELGCTIFLNTE